MWDWGKFEKLINPIQGTGEGVLNTIIGNLVGIFLTIAGLLAFIYLVYSGVQYIMSSGDPAKAATARNGIVYAIIGIIVIIVSYSLINFVTRAITHGTRGTGGSPQVQSSPTPRSNSTPTRLPNPLEIPFIPNPPDNDPSRIIDPNLMIETPTPPPRTGPF